MARNVLIIATSLRKQSNSDILAAEFAKGALEAGNQVEQVSLRGKDIRFCTGCLVCQKTQRCVIDDDAGEIVQKMLSADAIAFATPIYFYEMAGQMKTLLDRSNPLFPSEYTFKDIYLLAAAADTSESAVDGAVKGLRGWIDCFEKVRLKGVIRGVGIDRPEAARNVPEVLQAAYALGKNA